MISDTSHLFRQLQLAFCLKQERWGRREGRGETEGEMQGREETNKDRRKRGRIVRGVRQDAEGYSTDKIKMRKGGGGKAKTKEFWRGNLLES